MTALPRTAWKNGTVLNVEDLVSAFDNIDGTGAALTAVASALAGVLNPGGVKLGLTGWLESLVPATEQFSDFVSLSRRGGPGGVFATRTTDGGINSTGAQGAWAIGAFTINDNFQAPQTGYGIYVEPRRYPGAGVTEGIEIAMVNRGDVKQGSPLNWSQDGATIGLLVGSGRDDVSPNNNPTTGIVFAGSSARWQTGIIFGRGSLANNGGYPVSPVAIDFPQAYSLLWRDVNDLPAAYIRSDVTTSPNFKGAGGIVFTNSGVQLNSADNMAAVSLTQTGFTIAGTLFTTGLASFGANVTVTGTLGLFGSLLLNPTFFPIYANDAQAAAASFPLFAVYRNSTFGNCLKMREA
jgi:hypothetical protein